ncbi:MAG: hypothetical protein OXH97_00885 [Chloroflexota bacterium]|nr:hypothetical protein [Chloroflexota bacterium]
MKALTRNARILAITLLMSVIALGAGIAVAQTDGTAIRIVAMRHDDGRIEFAVQEREGEGWGERILPTRRFFPASGREGRWLSSSPITVGVVDEASSEGFGTSNPAGPPTGDEAWGPYRTDTYFARCHSLVTDEFIPYVAVTHPRLECLRPGGVLEPYPPPSPSYWHPSLTNVSIEFEPESFIEYRGVDIFINGEAWFDTLGEGGLQYTRRIGYGSVNIALWNAINRPDTPFVNGTNRLRIAIYGHWPDEHFCEAWYQHQREELNRPHGDITSCRGDDRLTDPDYTSFVRNWNQGELQEYTVEFDVEIRW